MTSESIELGELFVKRASVDPAKHSEESFELFSVPAYERRRPDESTGSEIGSSKVTVEPGDTLLCRIVPHIRRAWVVPLGNGVRQIASGEWMVLRHPDVDSGYLRQVLLSDPFHDRFMSTVAGVGGSLMRARPAHAASIPIPLPPLPEQRRIADILDRADDLRAKRRRALESLNAYAGALFDGMFRIPSDPAELALLPRLEEYAVQITDGEHQTPRRAISGNLLLSARNIRDGYLDLQDVDFVDDDEFARISQRCRPVRGDVLISCSGSVGRVATVSTDEPIVLVRSVAMVRPKPDVLPLFLERFLRSPPIQREISKRARSSAQANLFQGPIRSLPILVPPLPMQERFVGLMRRIDLEQKKYGAHLAKLDELFASLQHRAFSGQL